MRRWLASRRAAPSTACAGSIGSTPSPRAVEGMSCIRPRAPAPLTAERLNPLSTLATAASSAGETPCRRPACSNRLRYAAGAAASAGDDEAAAAAGRHTGGAGDRGACHRGAVREDPPDRARRAVDVLHLDHVAGLGRHDHLVVADVDADVVGRRPEAEQVAGPGLRQAGHGLPDVGLVLAHPRQVDAEVGVDPLHQTGAVQALGRVGATPDVGDAEVLAGVGHDLVAGDDRRLPCGVGVLADGWP